MDPPCDAHPNHTHTSCRAHTSLNSSLESVIQQGWVGRRPKGGVRVMLLGTDKNQRKMPSS